MPEYGRCCLIDEIYLNSPIINKNNKMDIRVRVRKTGDIRTVTHLAYAAMGPKVYEKLGPVDANAPSPNVPAQVRRSVSAAVPVVKAKIEAEPEAENVQEQTEPEMKVKGKPGRKKSISSNSTDDEK